VKQESDSFFDYWKPRVDDCYVPKSSIYEVAALAGVSIATVSRTMNQPHRVSETTRSRVMQAVHKLDYTPDFEAAARARHHSDRIAVLAPLNTYPGFIQRLRGISLVLEESQAELIIFQVDPKKLSNPQSIKFIDSLASSGRYDGLIIMSISISDQDVTRISETHFPTVLIETQDSRFPSFGVNNQEGAAKAVSHLIERGFKNIGFVGFNPIQSYSINASKVREQGYIDTLLQNGRTVNPEHLIFCEYSIEDTYQAALQMLNKPNRPDALFCASDTNALGVLKAARELNLEIPKDLAVVGFDDIEIADYLELTTIKQPLEGSGRQAAMLINKLIKDPTSIKASQIDLPLELIIRRST
jgi:DNA-binding LacI/PurR family transcriptional regulator